MTSGLRSHIPTGLPARDHVLYLHVGGLPLLGPAPLISASSVQRPGAGYGASLKRDNAGGPNCAETGAALPQAVHTHGTTQAENGGLEPGRSRG